MPIVATTRSPRKGRRRTSTDGTDVRGRDAGASRHASGRELNARGRTQYAGRRLRADQLLSTGCCPNSWPGSFSQMGRGTIPTPQLSPDGASRHAPKRQPRTRERRECGTCTEAGHHRQTPRAIVGDRHRRGSPSAVSNRPEGRLSSAEGGAATCATRGLKVRKDTRFVAHPGLQFELPLRSP
jgi:hypothetical protein